MKYDPPCLVSPSVKPVLWTKVPVTVPCGRVGVLVSVFFISTIIVIIRRTVTRLWTTTKIRTSSVTCQKPCTLYVYQWESPTLINEVCRVSGLNSTDEGAQDRTQDTVPGSTNGKGKISLPVSSVRKSPTSPLVIKE